MKDEIRLTADDVLLAPANITLKLTAPSLATYKIFGYCCLTMDEERLELRSLENELKMSVPVERVKELIVKF